MKVAVVTDYFSYSHQNYGYELTRDKLISMIRVEAGSPAIGWRVEREWVTQYGEVAVKVMCDTLPPEEEKGKITGDLMLVSSGDVLEKNEIQCEWKFVPAFPRRIRTREYQLKGGECQLQFRTVLNDTLLVLPQEGYWYADAGQPGKTESYRMNHSFWSAWMQSLLYALAGHVYPEVKLKNLEEDHRETRRGVKRVVQSRVTVHMKRIGIRDNRLFLEWMTENDSSSIENKAIGMKK